MRKMMELVLVFTMVLAFTVPVSALSHDVVSAEDLPIPQAVLTDLLTGEEIVLEAKPVSITSARIFSEGDDDSTTVTVGYEVFAPIDTGITAFDSGIGGTTTGGVTATVTATFQISSDLHYVKVTNVSGSWVPSSSIYYLKDRSYGVSSGALGKSINKTTSSNSFSYNTGWDYNMRSPNGSSQPHAWSDAVIWVSGMEQTGGKAISVQFPFASI